MMLLYSKSLNNNPYVMSHQRYRNRTLVHLAYGKVGFIICCFV